MREHSNDGGQAGAEVGAEAGTRGASEVKSTSAPDPDRGHVLIVDDERSARLTTEAVLLDDFSVSLAGSAEEALAHIRRSPVEVIVTDLVMPGMNGLDLIVQVKKEWHFVHAVLVTGHRDYLNSRSSALDVTFDLLLKPYNPSELIQVVRRGIQVGRLTRALSDLTRTSSKPIREGRS